MHEIVGMIRKDKIIAIIRGLEKGNLAPVVEALTGAYLASVRQASSVQLNGVG